jgi:hypothetical protein
MKDTAASKSDIKRLEAIMIASTDGFKRRHTSLRTEMRRGFARMETITTTIAAMNVAIRGLERQVRDLASRVLALENHTFTPDDAT